MKEIFFCITISILLLATQSAFARSQINIVGSSTVYPFATLVAENFGLNTRFKTPKVESTGSGGGLKLFCEGIGLTTPDITNASRRIKQSEIDKCKKNDVNEIIEVKFGYDGIVIANSNNANKINISLKHIFLALAKDVPNPNGSKGFIPNPYKKWSDIDATLPAKKIEVLGPPPTSGTRDAFSELALEGGCDKFNWIKALKKADKKTYKARCHSIREDGAYIEAGENDNLIVQKLYTNPDALGIFGYSFLEQNMNKIQGITVGNKVPTFENIADGNYPISRSLYFYVKKIHIGIVPGIMEYVKEFISSKAVGDDGYLIDKGLIPLLESEKSTMHKKVMGMEILSGTL